MKRGTGILPVYHGQDAHATLKTLKYPLRREKTADVIPAKAGMTDVVSVTGTISPDNPAAAVSPFPLSQVP